jgi:hypothetical protein
MVGGFLFVKIGSSAVAAPSPDKMSRKDVFGSARLTPAERTDGVATCHRRITGLAFVFASRGKSRRADLDQNVRRFCDCFVNQVEDRSSLMQYAMAMTVLAKGYAIRDYRSFPAFADYKSAARSHGMSADDFETMRRELGRSLTHAAEQCVENLR